MAATPPTPRPPPPPPHGDRSSGDAKDDIEGVSTVAWTADPVEGAKRRDMLSPPAPTPPESAESNRELLPQMACPLGGTAPPTSIPRVPQRPPALVSPSPPKPVESAAEEAALAFPTPTPLPMLPQDEPNTRSPSGSPRPDAPGFAGEGLNAGLLCVAAGGLGGVVPADESPTMPRLLALLRRPGVPVLLADCIDGLAGEVFVGTNTRAAAESSPFCNARDISLGESERSGREDDKEGVCAELAVVVTAAAVDVAAAVVADPVVAAVVDTAVMDGEDADEAAAFTAAVAAASCRCRCCPW